MVIKPLEKLALNVTAWLLLNFWSVKLNDKSNAPHASQVLTLSLDEQVNPRANGTEQSDSENVISTPCCDLLKIAQNVHVVITSVITCLHSTNPDTPDLQ